MTATASRRSSSDTTPPGSPVVTYYLLVVSTAILVLIGLAVVLSSTSVAALRSDVSGSPYRLFIVQLIALGLGLTALAIGSRMSVGFWKRAAPWVLYGSMILLVVVATSGYAVGGNRNWIRIGPMSFQPSEVAKLGLALYLGVVLAKFRRELTTLRGIMLPGGLMAGAVIFLVMLGQDLGTTIVLAMMVAAAFWVAGVPKRYFGFGAVVGVLLVLSALTVGETRSGRIDAWLNPETADPSGVGMQSLHGLWALASGGLWGLGPGMSREKWGYLPVADSDFAFAIIGEEFGLVGTLMVLVAFGMMAVAVNRLVQRHNDRFVQISSAAIGAWLVGQACMNIAVVIGLLPVTGVPLPFISSGGSSLIMSLAGVGVLMAFARHEPGAEAAFAARPSVLRRSIAVVSKGRGRE
ncbi:FtsW/RodA/SpoVE family cell cycle protein [Demequina sediminicola]|uniref:FtsW/RodA/SpoVE family cell cycle protein n=1 Tax=Demequina sediminicola TaxID=1095026 RepID=UPI000781EECA|nr:putative peptidoglycan glycosyltransferase FtsW [Demequina sediminicola]